MLAVHAPCVAVGDVGLVVSSTVRLPFTTHLRRRRSCKDSSSRRSSPSSSLRCWLRLSSLRRRRPGSRSPGSSTRSPRRAELLRRRLDPHQRSGVVRPDRSVRTSSSRSGGSRPCSVSRSTCSTAGRAQRRWLPGNTSAPTRAARSTPTAVWTSTRRGRHDRDQVDLHGVSADRQGQPAAVHPVETIARAGGQPFAGSPTTRSFTRTDFAGVSAVTTFAPNIKTNLAYVIVEDSSRGEPRHRRAQDYSRRGLRGDREPRDHAVQGARLKPLFSCSRRWRDGQWSGTTWSTSTSLVPLIHDQL